MDTLTHGLFGLAVGTLRPRDSAGGPLAPTDKATLLACVIAAELPDLDYLWPASDGVLVTLRAHRGLSHSLVAAPAVALVAAGIALLIVRRARVAPVYAQAVLAVVFAHLLPDLWTGWGTRLFLPWSSERMNLDFTMVLDPLVTLPLLVGAVFGYRARARDFRRPIWLGLAVASLYVGSRVAIRAALTSSVEDKYATSEVHVFPAPFSVLGWRYVAEVDGGYAAGTVDVGGAPVEQARHARDLSAAEALRGDPIIDEVIAWARYPTVQLAELEGGRRTLAVGDLRYHAGGEPTLKFVVELDAAGKVTSAKLDRGGSVREVIERFRR
ncbi:MAG: metal-dependent hydrolase [Polyangiaceae bacterium]|nr:metal-dependent hydrolase [Polyangiaceae bacterium]